MDRWRKLPIIPRCWPRVACGTPRVQGTLHISWCCGKAPVPVLLLALPDTDEFIFIFILLARTSMYWFSPQVPTTTGAGPGPEPGTGNPVGSPTWVLNTCSLRAVCEGQGEGTEKLVGEGKRKQQPIHVAFLSQRLSLPQRGPCTQRVLLSTPVLAVGGWRGKSSLLAWRLGPAQGQCLGPSGCPFPRGPWAGRLLGSVRPGHPRETGDSGSPWRGSSPHVPRDTGSLLLTRRPRGPARPEPARAPSVPPPRLGRAGSSRWSRPRYFQLGPLPASLGPRSLSLSGQDGGSLSTPWPRALTRPTSRHPTVPTLVCGPLTCLLLLTDPRGTPGASLLCKPPRRPLHTGRPLAHLLGLLPQGAPAQARHLPARPHVGTPALAGPLTERARKHGFLKIAGWHVSVPRPRADAASGWPLATRAGHPGSPCGFLSRSTENTHSSPAPQWCWLIGWWVAAQDLV